MVTIRNEQDSIRNAVQDLQKEAIHSSMNLKLMSDFRDDFKKHHQNNVKDVKRMKSKVSIVANDLDNHAIEIRQEIKSALRMLERKIKS